MTLIENLDLERSGYNNPEQQAELKIKDTLSEQSQRILTQGLKEAYCNSCPVMDDMFLEGGRIKIKDISRDDFYEKCPIREALGLK